MTLNMAAEQSKPPKAKCRRENTTRYYFTFCYFYLTRLFLSKAILQGNSIFITKLASCAREKAVVLLSPSLLFLLRSSQMLCLREINGFLNKLFSILWLRLPMLTFVLRCHIQGLERSSFREMLKLEAAELCGQDHQPLWYQPLSNPASPYNCCH